MSNMSYGHRVAALRREYVLDVVRAIVSVATRVGIDARITSAFGAVVVVQLSEPRQLSIHTDPASRVSDAVVGIGWHPVGSDMLCVYIDSGHAFTGDIRTHESAVIEPGAPSSIAETLMSGVIGAFLYR